MSRVSTIFTPRKKTTSFSSFNGSGASSTGHNTEQSTPAASIPTQEASSSTAISGGITRKGFEPVGHIAKPRKRLSMWKKAPSGSEEKEGARSSSLFPASGNMFSSSAISLGMRRSPQSKSKKRRASVSGGGWGGLGFDGGEEDESEDEIDEIRRPSDLGPAAEVMDEELGEWDGRKWTGKEKEKALPELPVEVADELDARFPWTGSSRPSSFQSIQPPPVDQISSNSQIITHVLQFLPKRSEVAVLATVSRTFLVAARRVLYGCVDLRSSVGTEPEADDGVSRRQYRKRKRKDLGATLESLVGFSLQERNGELFQETWGFLLDEWPYGWLESDEVEEDDEDPHSGHDTDAESQYTAYSDSDFTHPSTNVSQASLLLERPSLSLEVPQLNRKRSSQSLRSTNVAQRRTELQEQRKQRYHTLLKTLLASVPSLTTLLLPAFELGILKYHTAFGLRQVTFLNRQMADWEMEGMLGWLDGIVGVSEVRLPRLIDGVIEDEISEDEEAGARPGEDQDTTIKLKVNIEADRESADEGERKNLTPTGDNFPPPKKRKTLLIISPSSSSSPAMASSTPSAPNFRGTSFPMPPMTPNSLSLPGGPRPPSMLFPGLCPTSPSTPTPSSPSSLTSPRQASPSGYPSSHNSSPITPLTPITPMTPVTPFTPSFYMHSSSSTSSPTVATFATPDTEKRMRELGKKETLLPELRILHGPPSLVELLVPRRRRTVREVRLNVHGTIMGGQVKVGGILKGLVKREATRLDGLRLDVKEGAEKSLNEEESEANVNDADLERFETLAFHFSRTADRRTMEKVLAAVGAAVCGTDVEGESGGTSRRGVDTLEVIATCTIHPNSRKSDEAMYKTIHAVLPRYHSLQALVMHLSDPETGEILRTTITDTHNILPQVPLSPSPSQANNITTTNSNATAIKADTQVMVHTPPILNGDASSAFQPKSQIDSPQSGSFPNTTPDPPLTTSPEPDNDASLVDFPRMSPPLLSPESVNSTAKQMLRDRKMMRRFGSTTQRNDSLVSVSTKLTQPSISSVSFSVDGNPSVAGHHGHQEDGEETETDRETVHSSSMSHRNKSQVSLSSSSRSRHGSRSSSMRKSIGSLKSFTSLQNLSTIVNATKTMAHVVTAKKATLFRTGSVLGRHVSTSTENANGSADPASPTTPTASGIATPIAIKPIGADFSLLSSKGKEKEREAEDAQESETTPPSSLPTSPPPTQLSPPNDLSMTTLTASQRRHVRLWMKQCPSLRKVVFLTGATWERDPEPRS
ncbi:hypothetical protein V5O48_012622 [Marasmius crinis-equi]|uniref:F-box domain-containing protein n=1 Tax=Marasmius crinis-equi TaxID=585013 RepID=A0ABR3F297_9AGAR